MSLVTGNNSRRGGGRVEVWPDGETGDSRRVRPCPVAVAQLAVCRSKLDKMSARMKDSYGSPV